MLPDLHRHFSALGLNPGASANDIRSSYRKLIQKWHPDRFAARSVMQMTAEDHTKELNEAYEWLYKRRHYRKFLGATAAAAKVRPVANPVEKEDPAAEAGRKRPEPAGAPGPAPPPASCRSRFPGGGRRWRWAALPLGLAAAAGLAHLLGARWPAPERPAPALPPPGLAAAAAAPLDAVPAPGPTPAPPAAAAGPTAVAERPAALRPLAALTLAARPALASIARPGSSRAMDRPTGGSRPGRALTLESSRSPLLPPAEIVQRPAAPAAEARAAAERDRQLDASEAELETFGVGDRPERVRSLQGPPDEAIAGAMRYGSSIVYFENGRVSSWINGLPRLRIPRLSAADLLDGLDAFTIGSSRGEVFGIQGAPSAVFADGYLYGTSVVYFRDDRVVAWIRTEGSLRTRVLPRPLFLGQIPRLR